MEMGEVILTCMVVLLLVAGIYFTFKSRLFQLRAFPFIFKNTVGTLLKKPEKNAPGAISPFQAVTTALAGTMGVGNIAGVATAIVAGGPGAIFWMWISAFFGMMTKYVEIFLAVRYRQGNKKIGFSGGPMYYIEYGLGKKWLASIFALLCIACSLGVGNITQIHSVSSAVYSVSAVPPLLSGIVVALIVALVVFGGIKRIAAVTEAIIPFISIIYMFCAGSFLWINRQNILPACSLIFKDAFSLQPVLAGGAGYGISQALRIGLSRGVYTNEAGLGSAPIAHAAADCKSPAHQGVWGIFEVFLDTIVVCTITALVILTANSGKLWTAGLDGAPLTTAAFASVFGGFGSVFIAVSIIFFAVAAILGWCYYGEAALLYLFKGNKTVVAIYRILYISGIVIGAISRQNLVWMISDWLNALMALPNIAALFLLRNQLGFSKKQ